MNIIFQKPKSTPAQQEYIAALFIDIGIETLKQRRDYMERVCGRPVNYSDELFCNEANEVINQLKEQKENATESRRSKREVED